MGQNFDIKSNMGDEKLVEESITDALLEEKRLFEPSREFTKKALIKDERVYEKGEKDFEVFWADIAKEIDWFKKWDKVLEWNPPYAKWFVNGKLNVAFNCLDRHLNHRKNKIAIIWEGEPGDNKTYTYQQLHREVNKFANVLKDLGIQKGDVAALYLPMIPELAIAMLACARIGAIHNVVFAGFSSESLRERINNSGAKVLVTTDGSYRRGKILPQKDYVDSALEDAPSIKKVVIVKRVDRDVKMKKGRDYWWDELMDGASPNCESEPMDSEDILFILYTSGTTAKPKGVVHTTGGYLTGVYITTKWVFDLKENDTFWCTADIGWVTGHSYIVYGPLANGATSLMYEGAPDYPKPDRFWEIVDKYDVNVFYTAPTAIRACMKWGAKWPKKHDLGSLRLLGTVGEPINPEAWMWYYEHIGHKNCPIVDTWWQTETGMILITPLPGVTTLKPGSATRPFPGVFAEVVYDQKGEPMPPKKKGYLVITKPWPAMLRTLYKDKERYEKLYWVVRNGEAYLTGDGSFTDEDGYFWIPGRMDDVMNVAGHRLSSMELESALVDHESVAEAAVVGKTDELKGQVPVAFVILRDGYKQTMDLAKELRDFVGDRISPIAKPSAIRFCPDLPKTRSGKIMRRILRKIEEGKDWGDVTTLRNPEIVFALRDIVREGQ